MENLLIMESPLEIDAPGQIERTESDESVDTKFMNNILQSGFEEIRIH